MVEHVARGAVEQNEGIMDIGLSGRDFHFELIEPCETVGPGFEARQTVSAFGQA